MTREDFFKVSLQVTERLATRVKFLRVFMGVSGGKKYYHLEWSGKLKFEEWQSFFNNLGLTLSDQHCFVKIEDAPEKEDGEIVIDFT